MTVNLLSNLAIFTDNSGSSCFLTDRQKIKQLLGPKKQTHIDKQSQKEKNEKKIFQTNFDWLEMIERGKKFDKNIHIAVILVRRCNSKVTNLILLFTSKVETYWHQTLRSVLVKRCIVETLTCSTSLSRSLLIVRSACKDLRFNDVKSKLQSPLMAYAKF